MKLPEYFKSTHYWFAIALYGFLLACVVKGTLNPTYTVYAIDVISCAYILSRVLHKHGRDLRYRGIKTSEFQHVVVNIAANAFMFLTGRVPGLPILAGIVGCYVIYSLGRGITTKVSGPGKMLLLMR